MRILLVGNYAPDRQESMARFCQILERGLSTQGIEVRITRPGEFFTRWVSEYSPLRKWFGYLDKLVLYPWRLRMRARWADIVHICDHSNAPYVFATGSKKTLVTCHDLLAVRSSMGDFPENVTGWSGRLYQKLILRGLQRSAHIACASESTRNDVLRLVNKPPEQVSVVHNGLNYPYTRMNTDEAAQILAARGITRDTHFLLHVGGNQWYKNRMGVLHIFVELIQHAGQASLKLVLAGKALTDEMRAYIAEYNIGNRVFELQDVENEELRALYSCATGLLFPSLYEGFGWPVIEAQACGCPVYTSAHPPMTEIGGDCAVYIDPRSPAKSATRIIEAILRGDGGGDDAVANAARFTTHRMIENYVRLYTTLTDGLGAVSAGGR